MPITKSAKKAFRQNIRRRKTNTLRKNDYRKAVRTYKKLVVAGKKINEAAEYLKTVYKSLDKAVKGGTIKKNKASRLKSRLTALLKKAS